MLEVKFTTKIWQVTKKSCMSMTEIVIVLNENKRNSTLYTIFKTR